MKKEIIANNDETEHKIILTKEMLSERNWKCLIKMLDLPEGTNLISIWFSKFRAIVSETKA